MIEFFKTVGFTLLLFFLGFLIGERTNRKDKSDD